MSDYVEEKRLKENINPDINANTPKPAINLVSKVPLKQSEPENGCNKVSVGQHSYKSVEATSMGILKFLNFNLVISDHIDMLNDDTLLHVFSLLPRKTICRCLQVCKRWSGVAEHPSLWRTVNLSHKSVSLKLVLKLIRRQVVTMKLSSAEVCKWCLLEMLIN